MKTFPSQDHMTQSPFPPPQSLIPTTPLQQKRTLWSWWTDLTGQPGSAVVMAIAAQERLRRSRLISALLVLMLVVLALLIPSAFTSPLLWITIGILVLGALLMILFNRSGRTNLSAAICILLIDGALGGFLSLKPMLNIGNLSDFDLFILAVLVGGIILPRVLIPLTGIVQIGLIFAIFALRPHDALFSQFIAAEAGPYTILVGPTVLLAVGTGIAWLHAWSVERALVRASRAEELADARAKLERQAYLTAEQNQRLEEGIHQIVETHRQIAAGNLAARAPLQQGHELWEIGSSLNLLLKRFQQQVQDYRAMRQMQLEVEEVVKTLDAARYGRKLPVPRCNTPLALRLLIALGV